MKEELQGNLVFDTGPLLELLNGSTLGAMVRERLEFEGPTPMTGEMNIAELRYLTCRKAGWRKSDETVGALLNSGALEVMPASEFLEGAAEMKCGRSVSLIDCLTISMGERLGIPVVFAKHEREIDREVWMKPFRSKLLFLVDI